MANFQAQKNAQATTAEPDGARAAEIAQDLESLRMLAVRFRHLAPSAQERVLRAILGKRGALLESISARLAPASGPGGDGAQAEVACEGGGAPRAAFAQILGEICDLDREASHALTKRSDAAAAEIQKLRAGKKWRQSNSQ